MSLYVCGLSKTLLEEYIRNRFAKFGEIVRFDRQKNFCSLTYTHEKDAEATIREMDGKEFGGKRISVQWARNSHRYDSTQIKCYICGGVGHFARNCPHVLLEYEIVNGLSGMLRDIVIMLMNIFKYEENKIRAIIGMCRKHYSWKDHHLFILLRKHLYVENPFFKSYSILKLNIKLLKPHTHTTFFFNEVMNYGIYRLTMKLTHNLVIGIARREDTQRLMADHLAGVGGGGSEDGIGDENGDVLDDEDDKDDNWTEAHAETGIDWRGNTHTCGGVGAAYDTFVNRNMYANDGVKIFLERRCLKDYENLYKENITAEVNLFQRTLRYFRNMKEIDCFIENIPTTGVQFGIGGEIGRDAYSVKRNFLLFVSLQRVNMKKTKKTKGKAKGKARAVLWEGERERGKGRTKNREKR